MQNDWEIDIDYPKTISCKTPKSLSEIPKVLSSESSVCALYYTLGYCRGLKHRKFLFRGHSDKIFELVSSLGRSKLPQNSDREKYQSLKKICQKYSYEQFRHPSFNEELFYLSIGRHLSFTCRLLDWTFGFWDAISFILHDNFDKDGTLWVLSLPQDFEEENRTPWDISDERIHVLREHYYLPEDNPSLPLGIIRRYMQHGLFTVVENSMLSTPLNQIRDNGDDIKFYNFIVPVELKNELKGNKNIVPKDNLYIDTSAPILNDIGLLNNSTF